MIVRRHENRCSVHNLSNLDEYALADYYSVFSYEEREPEKDIITPFKRSNGL